MIEEVKKLRVKIDGLAQLTKNLEKQITIVDLAQIPANQTVEQWLINFQKGIVFAEGNRKLYISSKEVLKTIDSLYLAKAWLGKVLGELNVDSPYKSGYKTKEDIELTADVSKVLDEVNSKVNENINLTINGLNWKESNHIEKVDWLREEIKKVVKNINNLFPIKGQDKINHLIRNYKTHTYQHLHEARFWLGFELQRIKEEE